LFIGIILTVVLLISISFPNVIGNQSVKNTQEEYFITSKNDFEYYKNYLFETIVEISKNSDIRNLINSNSKPQRIILPFIRNNIKFKVEHLELLFNLGLKLFNRLDDNKLKEYNENTDIDNLKLFDQVEPIIMGNDELRERIYTLNKMNSEKVSILDYEYPIICGILLNIDEFISNLWLWDFFDEYGVGFMWPFWVLALSIEEILIPMFC